MTLNEIYDSSKIAIVVFFQHEPNLNPQNGKTSNPEKGLMHIRRPLGNPQTINSATTNECPLITNIILGSQRPLKLSRSVSLQDDQTEPIRDDDDLRETKDVFAFIIFEALFIIRD